MPNIEQYENLVLGSGVAGRLLTWTLASAGHRTNQLQLTSAGTVVEPMTIEGLGREIVR